jgi:hypothetical protein
MRTRIHTLAAAALSCGLAAGTLSAHAAGTVLVNFHESDKFSDIGRGVGERERNLEILEQHFKRLGRKLPDAQTLTIEVLDVDLAGEVWPTRRFGDLRILRGTADWPRMTLRWQLAADGKMLRKGEERVADMAYLTRIPRPGDSEALAPDLRMVDDWFARRFGKDAAPE